MKMLYLLIMNATSPPAPPPSFHSVLVSIFDESIRLGIWQRYWFFISFRLSRFHFNLLQFFCRQKLMNNAGNLRQRKNIFEKITAVSSQLSSLVNKSTRVESSRKLSKIRLRTLADAERSRPRATSARIHKHVEFIAVTMSLSFNELSTWNETDC